MQKREVCLHGGHTSRVILDRKAGAVIADYCTGAIEVDINVLAGPAMQIVKGIAHRLCRKNVRSTVITIGRPQIHLRAKADRIERAQDGNFIVLLGVVRHSKKYRF